MPPAKTPEAPSLPAFLLHRVDPVESRLTYLPTSSGILRAASFVDGRTPLATGRPITRRIDDVLRALEPVPAPRRRFIFHGAFGGSTLLSRLLDCPGKTLAVREPNSLVDIADWVVSGARSDQGDSRTRQLVRLACANLFASPPGSETIVVKPSNWANNLLPALCDPDSEAVFVTMRPRAFLRAVFRGGRERLAFAARATAHLAAGHAGDVSLLGAAAGASRHPLDQVAHFAALLHHLQLRRFDRAMRLRDWDRDRIISYEELAASPLAAAGIANRALGLGLSLEDLSRSVAEKRKMHAKDGSAVFEPADSRQRDEAVEAHHGDRIDRALAWYRDCLPDVALPGDTGAAARAASA
ncbi:hypothetical protein ACFQRC_03000 [Enterovirga sp. GCM10030262]|uniref:hypothetical protein n=1 Tax=Enterovirga sp. GCM10030262 TaxID=3273391 RepID=UPI0036179BAC